MMAPPLFQQQLHANQRWDIYVANLTLPALHFLSLMISPVIGTHRRPLEATGAESARPVVQVCWKQTSPDRQLSVYKCSFGAYASTAYLVRGLYFVEWFAK